MTDVTPTSILEVTPPFMFCDPSHIWVYNGYLYNTTSNGLRIYEVQ